MQKGLLMLWQGGASRLRALTLSYQALVAGRQWIWSREVSKEHIVEPGRRSEAVS